jgi:hypothetical protein
MSGFGKTIILNWQGVEYDLLVNMRVIAKIENDVNLIKLAQDMASGDVKMSHIAVVFTHLLKAAGAQVSEDDVWQAMFGDGAADIIHAASVALSCVFPEVKTQQGGKTVGKSISTRGKMSIK